MKKKNRYALKRKVYMSHKRLEKIDKAIKISKYNLYTSAITTLASSGFVLNKLIPTMNGLTQEEKQRTLKELIPTFASIGSLEILCMISFLMLACATRRKDSIKKIVENHSIKEEDTIPVNTVLIKKISNQYQTTRRI